MASIVDQYGMTPLHHAVGYGDTYSETPGAKIIASIDIALQHEGIDVNHRDKRGGMTALHYACATKHYDAAIVVGRLLRDTRVKVDTPDQDGRTALHYASGETMDGSYVRRNAAVVQLLIKAGANVQALGRRGSTPLHEACRGHNNEDHYYREEGQCDPNGDSRMRLEVIRLLLANKGTNIRARDEAGCLPLHYVRHPVIAELLLAGLTDEQVKELVNTPDKEGWTPLHCVLFYREDWNEYRTVSISLCSPCTAQFLIGAGSDVTKPTNGGTKPTDCIQLALDDEIDSGGTGETSDGLNQIIEFVTRVVLVMIEKYQDSKPPNDTVSDSILSEGLPVIGGKVLLRVMNCFTGDDGENISQHIDPLLTIGADITYADPTTGRNALHSFLANDDLDECLGDELEGGLEEYILTILQSLAERLPTGDEQVSFISAKTCSGENLLHFAGYKKYPMVMEWVFEVAGQQGGIPGQSPLWAGDSKGWTPLHVACSLDNPATVKVLVEHGCMVWDKTKNGETAWEIAVSRNQTSVIAYLETSSSVRRQMEEKCNAVRNHNLLCILLERLLRCGPQGLTLATKYICICLPDDREETSRKREHSKIH